MENRFKKISEEFQANFRKFFNLNLNFNFQDEFNLKIYSRHFMSHKSQFGCLQHPSKFLPESLPPINFQLDFNLNLFNLNLQLENGTCSISNGFVWIDRKIWFFSKIFFQQFSYFGNSRRSSDKNDLVNFGFVNS
eukprot:TRINITY_DN5234_c1_g1_i3.p1 TRINITY_DN5234_c1_g1~~TRINITY_DN5234_c1_g1_i3.p1  ORF type:complete len:135 (+),score=44.74 TRINITY_DN5234_c1_g1_i3:161-565(+)